MFTRMHATLYAALSVRPSIGWSVSRWLRGARDFWRSALLIQIANFSHHFDTPVQVRDCKNKIRVSLAGGMELLFSIEYHWLICMLRLQVNCNSSLIDISSIVEFPYTGLKGNYAWNHSAESLSTQYIDEHNTPTLYFTAFKRTKHSWALSIEFIHLG